jgi:hypothetical protein
LSAVHHLPRLTVRCYPDPKRPATSGRRARLLGDGEIVATLQLAERAAAAFGLDRHQLVTQNKTFKNKVLEAHPKAIIAIEAKGCCAARVYPI